MVENVRKFGKTQFETMGAGNIDQILKYISESQLKTLKEVQKYSAGQRDNWEKKWHETGKDSPLRKSEEQIKLLRKINDTLKDNDDYNLLTDIKNKLGTERSPQNTVINASAAAEMRDDVESDIEKVQDVIRKTQKIPENKLILIEHRQNLKNLKKALKYVNTLEEQVKNVPPDTGGTKAPKSFDTSKLQS